MTERERDMERTRRPMSQQLADFDIVELEMTLDDTREQYNTMLRNSNNKAQQKKMGVPGAQLGAADFGSEAVWSEQNPVLKKGDLHLGSQAWRSLLQDAQEKLILRTTSFETQLQAIREHLEQARSQKSASNAMNLNFGRIAKPLRGVAPQPSITVTPPMDENYSPNSPTKAGLVDRRTSWLGGWSNRA
ncbi:hypothetical protein BG006_006912 [Podila minutissima]|uniref:Uncharacterized protein n=1 Tax=Podila minutissima TaxID=64525 RepID=A0A9P5SMD9_9FUNG|nr:hypothetical protein BG006_006912 [Podila minutissima]